MEKPKRKQEVYTLVVQLGRAPDDGLPDKATGGALIAYASGVDEAEAVRETVAILKQAGLAPLEVESQGSEAEQDAAKVEIGAEERELMHRALAENSVVVVQLTPFYD